MEKIELEKGGNGREVVERALAGRYPLLGVSGDVVDFNYCKRDDLADSRFLWGCVLEKGLYFCLRLFLNVYTRGQLLACIDGSSYGVYRLHPAGGRTQRYQKMPSRQMSHNLPEGVQDMERMITGTDTCHQ